jgi:hypothetical protein
MIHYYDYSIFDANHHSTISAVTLRHDQFNGKGVVVKMIKCHKAQLRDLLVGIEILRRLHLVNSSLLLAECNCTIL